MRKIAFVFAGQGAQYVGMAKDVADSFENANQVFDTASNALGYDIKKLIFEGPEEKLKITENTQPAILTASYALLQPLLAEGIKPSVTAGLSLGEFTAHTLSGSLDFNDAVKVVQKRGKFMQEEVPQGVGGMSAVLGLDEETVEQACKEVKDTGYVACANYNCPGQIVVSGELKALKAVKEVLTERGAKRVIPLRVSAPFHCALLEGAGEKLRGELEKININDMQIPVIANVTGEVVSDKSMIIDLLVKQVSNTVKWTNSVKNMISMGVDTFVEIGPGKVLSGLIKKTDRSVDIFNVENMETLEKTLNSLK